MHLRAFGIVVVCGLLTARRGAAADLDKYLPDDAQFVISVNLRQLIDSELFKQFGEKPAQKQLERGGQVEKILDLIGLNPMKDLHQVTIAGPEAEQANKDVLVVIHGDLNPTKIGQAADAFATSNPDALTIEKTSEATLYVVHQDGKAVAYVAVPGSHVLLAAGTRERVLDAVAKHSGGRQTKVSAGLKELVGQINGKQSVWVAALVTDKIKNRLRKDQQSRKYSEQIDAVSGGLTITDSVKVNVNVHMSTPAAAADLTALLRFVVPFAGGMMANQPQAKDYAPLINEVTRSLKFTSEKKVAGVELLVSKQLINKIMDAAQHPPLQRVAPAPPGEKGQ